MHRCGSGACAFINVNNLVPSHNIAIDITTDYGAVRSRRVSGPARFSDRKRNRYDERDPKADPDPAPVGFEARLDIVCNQVSGHAADEENRSNDGRNDPGDRLSAEEEPLRGKERQRHSCL